MEKKSLTERLRDGLDAFIGKKEEQPQSRAVKPTKAYASMPATQLTTLQQTSEFDFTAYGNYSFLPRKTYEDVDITELLSGKGLSYAQIMAILPDIDPDVSMALWTVLRMAGGDWKASVYKDDAKQNADDKSQKLVDDFLRRVGKKYGGVENVLNQFNQSAYLQGAVATEAVLSDKYEVVDIAAINPYTIYFKAEEDGSLGVYQYQNNPGKRNKEISEQNGYVKLNPNTFWYIPLDPAVGDPYGRSPVSAAIAEVFFNIQVLFDLRKVVHNQGWPRLTITVVGEVIKKMAPDSLQEDENRLNAWVSDRLSEIASQYNNLRPDDSFVQTDGVKVDVVGNAQGAAFNASELLKSIERRIIRGLKQLPILMGSNEGTTETHGTVQYDIYIKGIESFQKLTERAMENILNLFLQLQGIQAYVEFKYDKIDTRDRLKEAQAETIEIQNEQTKVDAGWISNEEASIKIVGAKPAVSDEDLAAKKQAELDAALELAKAQAGSQGGQTDPKAENRLPMAVQTNKLTLTAQKKKLKNTRKGLLNSIANSFAGIEQAVDLKEIYDSVTEQFPFGESRGLFNSEQNRVDTGSVVYKKIYDLVSQYYATDKAKAVIDNMSEEGASYLIEAFENNAQNVLIRIGRDHSEFAGKLFRLEDPRIIKFIEDRAKADTRTSIETSKGDVAKTIMSGYQENKTYGEIAKDLQTKFGELKTSRATLIANMELNFATSEGTLRTMQKNKVDKKEWHTVGDANVRPDHQANADEGPIPVNQAFRGTGDMAPPADFNCRCNISEALDPDWTPPAEIWTGGTN